LNFVTVIEFNPVEFSCKALNDGALIPYTIKVSDTFAVWEVISAARLQEEQSRAKKTSDTSAKN
jgi:hypothetical protein